MTDGSLITPSDLVVVLMLGITFGIYAMRIAIAIQRHRAARRRDLTSRQIRAERMFLH